MKNILRRILKILGWTAGVILFLIIVLVVAIQLPSVQHYARGKIVAYLEKTLGTDVEIGRLGIAFPKKIVLEHIFFGDQKKDTLLAGRYLAVDLDMFKLIDGKVKINSIELDGIYANIYRKGRDSFFNYEYIIDAFTSPPTTPEPVDTSAGLQIDLGRINLSEIRLKYLDDPGGIDFYLALGLFETKVRKFDLDHMRFDIGAIELRQVVTRIYRRNPLWPSAPDTSSSDSEPIALKLGPISLENIQVDYSDEIEKIAAAMNVGTLNLKTEKIDLDKIQFDVENLELKNTTAKVHMLKQPPAAKPAPEVTSGESDTGSTWAFLVANLDIQNTNIQYDDDNEPRVKGMDYAHIKIEDLNLGLKDLSLTPELYQGEVLNGSMKEQSGFELQELETKFAYNDRGVQLRKLLVKTNRSYIKDELLVGWPSLEMLSKDPGKMQLNARLIRSYIGYRDILIFVPDLASMEPFNKNPNGVLKVNGVLRGYLNNLEFPLMEVNTFQHTVLKIRGRAIGLPDVEKGRFDLNIEELSTTKEELALLVPEGTIPPDIQIPEVIRLKGTFKGSMKHFTTRMMLNSSRGSAIVHASMAPGDRFDVEGSVQDLDLNYILINPDLGKVTGKVSAHGSGFDPKTMAATIKASIDAADYNGYTYHNFLLNANIANGDAIVQSSMRDPNLSFSIDALALMKGSTYPALKMDLHLDSANLQKLGFYEEQLHLHGHVTADLFSTDPDDLEGTVDISKIIILHNGKRHAHPDTIRIVAVDDSGSNRSLSVYSDVLYARLAGQYKLTELATAVQHTISRYYHIPGFKDTAFTPQQWTINAIIRRTPLIDGFVPEMHGTDSLAAFIEYASTTESLKMTVDAPIVVYGTTRIDSLKVRVSTTDSLNYAITLDRAMSGGLQVYKTSLSGHASNNAISTKLDVNDRDGKLQYTVGANIIQPEPESYKIALSPELLLDYERWQVTEDNFISYDPRGLVIHDFAISSGGQSLSAASRTDIPGAPIDINFKQFRISTLTRIARQQDLLADGIINGEVHLRNPTEDLQLTSNIRIQDLSYRGDTLGNLSLKVNHEVADEFVADLILEGHDNNLKMAGTYVASTEAINMDLEIRSFSLKPIPNFSLGHVSEAGGTLRGNFGVKGTLKNPSVAGEIRFDSAFVRATLLGEKFAFTDETIQVDAEGVHFDHFTLVDSSKNKAEIDGDILTDNFRDYRFALDIKADNFRLVNSTRGITHKPFYGKLNVSTNTKIRGGMNLPEINSYVRIEKNTDFSYVLPSNDPEVQSRQGVVEFVDFSEGVDSSIFKYVGDSAANAGVTGLNLATTIETDSGANFNIVLDERNGDAIHIRGTAALEAGIDRSGKVSLTGVYTLNEGSYLLTLNFLRRQFFIKPGSSITWDGEPMLADVDITAIYIANTAPIDLVQHQLAGRSQYEINQYKQRVPFQVLLNMKGSLQHPSISFDIDMDDRDASRLKDVDAKLAQIRADESEINKQVFALLLLGHFVDENPLVSAGAPTTAESFARESASRILTDQLNRIAGNLVKGVDLTFGVNSGNDYSTGDLTQRTDLSIGVSKRLMNDRLKVNVGSTFGIEGATSSNNQASNIAGNASLDYVLTKDGRYIVRGYYRNDYEGQVEGQIQETGATLIFRIDYDNISEFFRKSKSKSPNTTVR